MHENPFPFALDLSPRTSAVAGDVQQRSGHARRSGRIATRVAVVAALPALLTACSGRSVEAYCATFYGEGSQLRDGFQEQADSMGDTAAGVFENPFGTALGSFVSGLSLSGPAKRVDAYTLENCGPPPAD